MPVRAVVPRAGVTNLGTAQVLPPPFAVGLPACLPAAHAVWNSAFACRACLPAAPRLLLRVCVCSLAVLA